MNSHLSSEQIDCVLSGRASAAATRHVGECAECSAEVESLREVFGNFREAAGATAEHHRRFVLAPAGRRVPRMVWGLATAALFLSVAAPVMVHRHTVARGVVTAGVVAQVPETMSDAALLNDVQNDLSSSVPESLVPLSGTSSSATDSTNARRKN